MESKNIDDKVLCIELIKQNLSEFTSWEIRCFGILFANNDLLSREFIHKWCESIDHDKNFDFVRPHIVNSLKEFYDH